jgi:hypothetical protein
MVSFTRTEGKSAFDHVVNEVLGRNDTSKLKRALIAEGITNFFDLSSLEDDIIEHLEYPDKNDPEVIT